jgi:hypothetical protein
MKLFFRTAKPSRGLDVEGEGDRGGEDEAEEKESSRWGMMRTMMMAARRCGDGGNRISGS